MVEPEIEQGNREEIEKMMNKYFFRTIAVAATVALIATGCAKKPKLNLANLREGTMNAGAAEAQDTGKDPFQGLDFNAANNGNAPDFVSGDNAGNNAGAWGSMDKPVSAGDDPAANFISGATAWSKKVYFDYNRHEIKASQRPVLDELAGYLTENANKAVVIEGHCDERGSDEYNRALSEKRAIAIREYLSNLGIAANRMLTVPCGEDRPEVPNATSPSQHAKNRRGQFQVGDKK